MWSEFKRFLRLGGEEEKQGSEDEGAVPKDMHGFLPFNRKHMALLWGEEYADSVFAEAKNWASPALVVACDEIARPGYQSSKANEFLDHPEVLSAKVKLLAKLIKSSKNFTVYSGAGISTAAGIGDYATRATKSVTMKGKAEIKSWFDAQPTLAHCCLTSLYHAGYLKHWVQQNHDGLPQKAGFPQAHINEIHGAWYDPSNLVVKMNESLRDDLFQWLLEWEEKCDLCLVLGTSLAGMNADRIASSTASRCMLGTSKNAFGMVIVNLQQTLYDSQSSVRIYAKIDDVMKLLLKELDISNPKVKPYSCPAIPKEFNPKNDVFVLRYYNAEGKRINGEAPEGKRVVLDLTEGAKIKVTDGQWKNDQGKAVGRNNEGHYCLAVEHEFTKGEKTPKVLLYGFWWIQAAINGEVESLPAVNIGESLRYV